MSEPVESFTDAAGWRQETRVVNGQRIGKSIPPAHYPSSAELDELRRWTFGLSLEAWPLPRKSGTYAPGMHHPDDGGAWPHELDAKTGGIGYRFGSANVVEYVGCDSAEGMRREANRLRSNAYAIDKQAAAVDSPPGEARAFYEAVETFTPQPRRAYSVRTRLDGTAYIEWRPVGAVLQRGWTEHQMAAWQAHRDTH